jgi:hypothetical protein
MVIWVCGGGIQLLKLFKKEISNGNVLRQLRAFPLVFRASSVFETRHPGNCPNSLGLLHPPSVQRAFPPLAPCLH